jgi:hypothetical protein
MIRLNPVICIRLILYIGTSIFRSATSKRSAASSVTDLIENLFFGKQRHSLGHGFLPQRQKPSAQRRPSDKLDSLLGRIVEKIVFCNFH